MELVGACVALATTTAVVTLVTELYDPPIRQDAAGILAFH